MKVSYFETGRYQAPADSRAVAASSSANWHLAVWMNRRLQNRVLIFANVGGLAIVQ